ncbi:alkaline phosphatase family protein [Nocardioides sp. SYSU DS0651]|uniref:alkaline phosphatase family protein n=1 Tax=Nocardioides sp. SYSU DS0651 TaxID=3415955 RepID=UPI003F4B4448
MISTCRGGRPLAVALALALSLLLPLLGGAATPASHGASTAAETAVNGRHVVAVSVDGLNPSALSRLGRDRTPYLHKLIYDQGAGTTNARSQVEMTVTLPNHTSMVTGRAIRRANDGHGVTWNDDATKRTVDEAAGERVSSVFKRVHAGGGRTAVFATKRKFWLFERSWPGSVHKNVIRVHDDTAVTRALRADLAANRRALSFLHLGLLDHIGHEHGWMSRRYLSAVERVDQLVGSVMRTIRRDADLRSSTVLVLTGDHGGVPGSKEHGDPSRPENFRVPFAVWGAGVANEPLYRLNPGRAWPRATEQPTLSAPVQPIRNSELANLSLDVLGLGPVPGSRWNPEQDLAWR